MTSTDDYHDFSAIDATEHLANALHHFFHDESRKYKFALVNKHYEEATGNKEYADSKRLFKIILGTDIVTNKLITSYKSTQGYRYLFKKDYFQQIQRMIRNRKRTQTREKDTSHSSTKRSPFIEAMNQLNDTSDDDSSVELTNDTSSKASIANPTNLSPNAIDQDEQEPTTPSLPTDLTRQAADIEHNMQKAMETLQDPENEPPTVDYLTPVVTTILKTELNSLLESIMIQDSVTRAHADQCKKQSTELDQLITSTKTLQTKLQSQYDRMEAKLKFLQRKFDECSTFLNDMKDTQKEHLKQLEKKYESRRPNTPESTIKMDDMLNQVSSKFKRRLHRLKDTTTKLFEQQDNESDLLHDRILRIEDNIKKLQDTNQTKSTHKPKRLFSDETTSDESPYSKKPDKFRSTSHFSPRPINQHQHTFHRGPNMEYLRKNVNITCSDQDQILEFYIKLRLAIAKGGIFIKPIEDINKRDTIAQDDGTSSDLDIQSNALFTLLSNEKFIPNDFVMAQNCLLAHSSTMNGFGALKAMLKLTHPILTMKRPPTTAPVLSQSQDIHTYEQGLKNFYLLHKLYNDTTFTPLEKAKQFIQGIDDDQYSDAITRIRHQLDTVHTMNVPLHDDYTIENLTSTIINITNEDQNNKAIVRTIRQSYKPQQTFQRYRQNNTRQMYPTKKPLRNVIKFTKAQCHACRQYGHIVTHCELLPRVLAIIQFAKKNGDKCEYLLKQYTQNNSVDSKKTFVRVLQEMNVLPQDGDSDTYMEDEIIINTTMDNVLEPNECISDE